MNMKQMQAMMKRPIFTIKNADSGKVIGRLYRSKGFTTVKLYARPFGDAYETTKAAIDAVESKLGKTVEVV